MLVLNNNRNMGKRRTNVDFSNHKHSREVFKSEDGNKIIVDHFKKLNTTHGYIKLTNTFDSLLITGDYGNWVFNRPFIPSSGESVCDNYWLEKMRMSSQQKFDELDWDNIEQDINNLINGGLEEIGYDGDEL